ncbi:mechanosensitive ion channel family protein [Candidatus Entotheonella palauensis]|uniref:mechanosensitive ion channel family protein n=1 Tax=Candidatus Entotheonella palauensis TaxID=93172 RepID=UPI000B7DCDF1|nr:mechanosensitive ion channel family protein [Candidatus Entotheonella palauensis]
MRQILQKIAPSAIIFILCVAVALLSDSALALFDDDITKRVMTVTNYVVQILTVLSGLYLLIRLINILVWDRLVTQALGTPVPRLIKDLSAILICLIGITIIVGVVFEQPVTGIWATSGAFGVVIGFALRSLILDTFTGLAINVDNSYKIGDWVHVHSRNRADYIGCILEINWRTTRLKTTDNNVIIIPNSLIGQSIVTNFSTPSEISRFELYFSFDANLPSERVIRVLLAGVKGAISRDGIEEHPEPSVRINQVTDMGIEYRIRYWIYPAKLSPPKARHAVISSVQRNLRTAGISLAHPKQDVSLTRRPARSLNSDLLDDRVALLSSIDLFRHVELEALQSLASNFKTVAFKRLDNVVVEGDKGDSMFIVIEGLLDVYVRDEADGKNVKVGHITSGQFFGEMALLTGKPRSATLIASTDVVTYEITYQCMQELFQTYPKVLDAISTVFAERQLHEKQFLEDIHKPEAVDAHDSFADDIMLGIRNFFGFRRRN